MQCMGFGAVIRDHSGLVCAAKCMKIEGIQETVVGEALAALAAVEFSKEEDFQDVILKGDSLQVVQALKEMGPNWRPYGHIVDNAKALLCTCQS
jgi:ribonuclease HI